MNRIALALIAVFGWCQLAYADVTLLDQNNFPSARAAAKPGDKRVARPDNIDATGSVALTDNTNLEYFINTDITFSTSSSASGAASEASYTGPVAADTSGGGTVNSSLNDAFDGFGSVCISTSSTGPCVTGNAAITIYNDNGPATLDATCNNRQVNYPTQTAGNIAMSRKVFVPSNDAFIRWLNVFTNNGGAAVTINVITSNNLGSDANTTLVTSSDGDAVAETTDNWITSFQSFSGTTSSDPRIAHVIQGTGAAVPVSAINFVNGDDNPFWSYALTLQPGQTRSIMTFASGQPTRAAAAAKGAQLAALPANTTQCLSATEISQVANFAGLGGTSFSAAVPAGNRYGWAALVGILLVLGAFVARRVQHS